MSIAIAAPPRSMKRQPVLAVGRVAVAVDGRRPLAGDPPVEDSHPVDPQLRLFDRRATARTIWRMRVRGRGLETTAASARVRAIRDRLREMYGQPVNEPHRHPIAELVKTVLSQHTNDRNRDRAFAALRERFPTWEEVRDAPVERGRGGDPARRAGASRRRRGSRRSSSSSASRPDLDWTETAPREESLELPARAAGGRAQNRGLRADLHLGHPRDPGRRPRPPGRRPARPLPAEGLLRARPRRDAGDRRPRGRLRAAHEPDPPRARGLPAEAALRECELRRMCPWYRAASAESDGQEQ